MPKAKTPTFITELELVADSSARRELKARFNAGFRLANAIQSEMLVRMELVRNSPEWAAAKKIPAKIQGKPNKKRGEAFQAVKEAHRFTKSDAEKYAALVAKRSIWIWEKLDSVVVQTLAERIFKAVDKILFGKARKVRFKNNRSFKSMQGKQISTSIRVVCDKKTGELCFTWGKLVCPVKVDLTDPCKLHGLKSDWKFARIVRRSIRGKERYFVQLACEGRPFDGRDATKYRDAESSIDLNISAVAMVGNDSALLEPFAPNSPKIDKEIAAIQRKQDRSRRINNPDNFNPDKVATKGKKGGRKVKKKGQIKQGKKLEWNNSGKYFKLGEKRRKLERSRSEYVRCENRKLANKILRVGGIHLNLEDVSVKGWQKRYGKAISRKSPGFFQSELVRKAESAGGTVLKYSTQKTACSQTHLNGEREKKSLSQRVHYDKTGAVMHRDLFSAFLGLYVNQDSLLMVDQARNAYPSIEPILTAAWQVYGKQTSQSLQVVARSPESPTESVCVEGQKSSQIKLRDLKARPTVIALQLSLDLA